MLIRLELDILTIFYPLFNLWLKLILDKDPHLIKLFKKFRNFPFNKIIVVLINKIIVVLRMVVLEIYNPSLQKQCLIIIKMIENKI